MKIIIPFLLIILFAGVVYYFGLYTYFLKTEVKEDLPMIEGAIFKPKIIASGFFGEIDFIHKGSGEAKILELDGKIILRLENFSVTSGPDLFVYLSSSQKPTHNIADLGEYVDLGVLKATSGNQNYDVPSGAEKYHTAVIWCKRFGALFSFALMN